MSESLSPVVLFVYKRPLHLAKALDALSRCPLIESSTLIIYSDAAKHGARAEDLANVRAVRDLVHKIDWCGELVVREREVNYGFQNHILGIGEVLETYDRVIVLEDDLLVSPSFLEFMNCALDVYREDDDVMHVSGYMLPLNGHLPDTLFYNAASCWGWGTWQRAWKYFRDEPAAQMEAISIHPKRSEFDCPPYWYLNQLRDNVSGAVRTWDGMWHASVFLRGGWCLHPGRSLVNNIGHDGSGENCVPSQQFDTAVYGTPPLVKRIAKREHPRIRSMIEEQFYIRRPGPISRVRHWIADQARAVARSALRRLVPELELTLNSPTFGRVAAIRTDGSAVDSLSKLYPPYRFESSSLGAYSYIAEDSIVKNARIGKFVSVGAGFRCGFGLHPVDTVSTSPVFYSVRKQCGATLSRNDKVVETRPIEIGNDVYIGMNVTVLDGVCIGDGAVVGAGAVVTKDIPPYAIAVGIPARVVRYRFDPVTVSRLLATSWWDGDAETLARVERHVLSVQTFLAAQESNAVKDESP
jgi:acetyltransferase-like isoleucine patch superfamily enzyme